MTESPITFFSEDIEFNLENEEKYAAWIEKLIASHTKIPGDVSYVFCSDEYLHKLNVEHLNHDTLTDIITFDYCQPGILSGDLFISIERVKENAQTFGVPLNQEILRVMSHGILHLAGLKDKSQEDAKKMREEEELAIQLFE